METKARLLSSSALTEARQPAAPGRGADEVGVAGWQGGVAGLGYRLADRDMRHQVCVLVLNMLQINIVNRPSWTAAQAFIICCYEIKF